MFRRQLHAKDVNDIELQINRIGLWQVGVILDHKHERVNGAEVNEFEVAWKEICWDTADKAINKKMDVIIQTYKKRVSKDYTSYLCVYVISE